VSTATVMGTTMGTTMGTVMGTVTVTGGGRGMDAVGGVSGMA